MPKIEARILGLPDNLSVEWRLDLTYERRSGRDDLSLPLGDAEEPGFEVYGDTPWRLWEEFPLQPGYEFVGGNCVLSYQILGVPGAPEGEIKFQILGENPDDDRCKAHIIANQGAVWYAWAIAKHESRQGDELYNQFNSGGDGPAFNAEPNFGPTDGWGLFQRDGSFGGVPSTTLETWSWEENMKGFLNDEYIEHLAIADTYISGVESANPATFEEPQFTIKGRTISGRDVLAMTWYNGRQGRVNSTMMPFDGSKPSGERWSISLPNAPGKDQSYVKVVLDEYNDG